MLCCLLVACLVLCATAAPSNTPSDPSSDYRGYVQCVLKAGGADMAFDCTGGPVMAAADDTPFLSRRSQGLNSSGVTWNSSCATPGCLLTICGDSKVVFKDSTVASFETFAGLLDSILCVVNNSHVVLQDSSITGNQLMRGVYGYNNARIELQHTSISGNSLLDDQGAGVRVTDHAEVTIAGGSVIERNLAPDGNGAGVFAGTYAVVNVVDSTIANNTCDMFGGGVSVVGNAALNIAGRSVIEGNIAKDGGGVAVLGNATVKVSKDVVFGRNRITDKAAFGFDLYSSSSKPVQLPEDCGGVSLIEGDQPSSLTCITKCSPRVSLRDGACGAGMGWDAKTRGCVCCPERSFSFEVSYQPATDSYKQIQCKPCPANARCPGGDVVRPLPGHARSSEESEQVHKCPLSVAACAGSDQCQSSAGYSGLLCTLCLPGFGTTSPLRCGRCMNPGAQFGLYIFMFVVVVVFVALTVHISWKDAERAATLAATSAPPAPTLQPSDAIKVLVQFLQYLVIIGTVSVNWPQFMVNMFRAATVVFGASGEAVSLDCWLSHYFPSASPPLAIKRQVVPFLALLIVFPVVVLVQILWGAASAAVMYCGRCVAQHRRRRRGGQLDGCCQSLRLVLNKLPLTALVVIFYAYPSLLRASLGFFACLGVDSAGSSTSTVQAGALKAHAQGYWVGDTRQECFGSGSWHRAWAFGLGIPSLLLLCVGIPGGLLWVLKANEDKAEKVAFRRHFGFLYCSFRVPERVWWEAVWAAQTVALSVVAVFHYQVEAYYSMLLLAVIFCISIAAQQVFKPYTVHSLHVMHLAATVCLLFTVFGALAMFTVDKSAEAVQHVHTAVGILVLVMNALMVGWCVFALAKSSSSIVGRMFGCIKGRVRGMPSPSAGSRVKGLLPPHPQAATVSGGSHGQPLGQSFSVPIGRGSQGPWGAKP